MMRHFLLLQPISLFLFFLFSSEFSWAQEALDTAVSVGDPLEVVYEKVMLDGQIAYRHPETDKILTEAQYYALKSEHFDTDDSFVSLELWSSDRVNAYRNIAPLSTPFKINFNQTTFAHPVDGEIVVTSRFGRRRRGPHRGIDLDLSVGDNVRSVLAGKVRFVGYSRGHGKTVVVRHANDIETVYAHLSSYDVKVNDIVGQGQILGKGGITGNARGSHLHMEVRYKGVCIHPEYIFNFDGSRTIRGQELWVTNGWKSARMHSSYRQSDIESHHTEADALVAQAAEPQYHRVVKGDTLSQIARSYSLSVRDICYLNRISKNGILKVGQVLQVR